MRTRLPSGLTLVVDRVRPCNPAKVSSKRKLQKQYDLHRWLGSFRAHNRWFPTLAAAAEDKLRPSGNEERNFA